MIFRFMIYPALDLTLWCGREESASQTSHRTILRGLNPNRSTLTISSAFLWSESDGVTGQKFVEVQVATTCT